MNQPDTAPPPSPHRPRMALVASGISMATVLVMIVIKLIAFIHSGTASALASLVDSATDVSTSIVTFLAISYSLRPADADHRHGHGKAEGVSAIVQAAFIGGSGVFLMMESINRFTHPQPVGNTHGVIIAMALSTALSFFLITVQKISLRQAPSLAVEADKEQYAADIVVNIGVIVIMLLLGQGAPTWVDPAFAAVVCCWLAWTVRKVCGKGMDMLLDRELPDDIRHAITLCVMAQPGVMGMHDLRTYKSGMKMFMSFDIEADPVQSLHDAHEITRAVERALLADFPQAEIMIHVDPFGDTEDSRHQVAGVHL